MEEQLSTTTTTTTTSYTGVLSATITILITTLDDCVWLVPYLSLTRNNNNNNNDYSIIICNGITFAITFILLTSIVSICTYIFIQQSNTILINNNNSNSDTGTTTTSSTISKTNSLILECFGAILCWSFAIYYFYKSYRKNQQRQRRRRKELEQQEQREQEEETDHLTRIATDTNINSSSSGNNYGSCTTNINDPSINILQDDDTKNNEESHSQIDNYIKNENNTETSCIVRCTTIIMLTISGAIDEISYFPSLIIGHIYTITELIVGTIITVIIMIVIVTQLLNICKPLLHCLDQIPLYSIITIYAILLTVNVVIDLYYN